MTRSILAFPIAVLAAALAMPLGSDRVLAADFAIDREQDRLVITDGGKPVATYVFRDERIARPYFAHFHAPGPIQVTRNHPPVPGVDATDHDTIHPGVWLAFGDISGQDFWRNKATIVHSRFVEPPKVRDAQVMFAAEDLLLASSGEPVCKQITRFTLSARPAGYLLIWDAAFSSADHDFAFGDQEEMGLGVRVVTSIAEKNGGVIRNSAGGTSAEATWGRIADWSDYSGVIGEKRVGVLLMPDPGNFRPCWFHNRDYGFMAANPFGRNAFTKGQMSAVVVKKGDQLRLRYGVLFHATKVNEQLNLDAEYRFFVSTLSR